MQVQTAGQYIRDAREARGWTQAELGERVSTSMTTVSNWERGITMPGIEDINSLCMALGLSAEVLLQKLGVILTPPAAARLPRELIQDALALGPEELDALAKAAKGLRLLVEQSGSQR